MPGPRVTRLTRLTRVPRLSPRLLNAKLNHDRLFRSAYGKLVAATWQDSKVLAALKKNPARVLAKYGLHTKPGAKINVEVVAPTGYGSVESQQAAWALGQSKGVYTVYIPSKLKARPSIGGGIGPVADSCCCTPCCCCT